MIQIYSPDNTNYSENGNSVLEPSICDLDMDLYGGWNMELEYPIDDEGKYKQIVEEAVISAPTPVGEKQLFRIYEKNLEEDRVTAFARPIFMDSRDEVFLTDKRPTNVNGQAALDIMTQGTDYSGESDITVTSTAYYVRKNLMEAIGSNDDNSFLNRWGGEVLYDNKKVIINKRVGGDYGVSILYGKNLSSIKEKVNMDNIITRIVPVAYNGYTLDGDMPWVDSVNNNKYAKLYTKEVKFEDVKLQEDCQEGEKGFSTLVELRAELKKRCLKMFEDGADTPDVTLEIEMVDLSKTEEYKDYKVLERVGLGDTVYCRHPKLDITAKARVIEVKWDCIRDEAKTIKIGDAETDYFNGLTNVSHSITQVIAGDNTVMADKIKGVLDAMNTQLKYQKDVAKKQDVRAILFEDLNKGSNTYGALAIGTQGIQIANERTSDGRDWKWKTAIGPESIFASVIVSGILSDKTGRNYWDLDKGILNLSGTFNMTGGSMSVKTESSAQNVIVLKSPDYTSTFRGGNIRQEVPADKSIDGNKHTLVMGVDGTVPYIHFQNGGTLKTQINETLISGRVRSNDGYSGTITIGDINMVVKGGIITDV